MIAVVVGQRQAQIPRRIVVGTGGEVQEIAKGEPHALLLPGSLRRAAAVAVVAGEREVRPLHARYEHQRHVHDLRRPPSMIAVAVVVAVDPPEPPPRRRRRGSRRVRLHAQVAPSSPPSSRGVAPSLAARHRGDGGERRKRRWSSPRMPRQPIRRRAPPREEQRSRHRWQFSAAEKDYYHYHQSQMSDFPTHG